MDTVGCDLNLIFVLSQFVPRDLITMILMFIKMFQPELQKFDLIYNFPQAYWLQFVQNEIHKRHSDFRKIGDLVIAATIRKERDLVLKMITYVFQHQIIIESPGQTLQLFKQQMTQPNIFSELGINNFYLNEFRRSLFYSALAIDNGAPLQLMCPNISNNLGELLCYFVREFKLQIDSIYISLIAMKGDMSTLKYIYKYCRSYADILVDLNNWYPIVLAACYGGHIDLSFWLFKINCVSKDTVYQTLAIGLLRHNHLEKFKALVTNTREKLLREKMDISHIFMPRYLRYFPNLPLISLETFEYCLEIFGQPKRGKFRSAELEIFAPEIIEKYQLYI